MFAREAVCMDLVKDILGNGRLLWGCCAAEMIKGQFEPVVDASVDRIVLVTQFLAGDALFQSFCFGGSAVFVRTAD